MIAETLPHRVGGIITSVGSSTCRIGQLDADVPIRRIAERALEVVDESRQFRGRRHVVIHDRYRRHVGLEADVHDLERSRAERVVTVKCRKRRDA